MDVVECVSMWGCCECVCVLCVCVCASLRMFFLPTCLASIPLDAMSVHTKTLLLPLANSFSKFLRSWSGGGGGGGEGRDTEVRYASCSPRADKPWN